MSNLMQKRMQSGKSFAASNSSEAKEKIVGTQITKSLVNYELLEVTAEEKEKLIEYEQDLLRGKEEFERGTLVMGEALYRAQQALANNKNGAFYKWFGSIGLKKDFVYMAIKRHEVSTRYNNERVGQLPEKVVKEIYKLDEKVGNEVIQEIIEATKPLEKIKELKNILSGDQTTFFSPDNQKSQEAEIIEAEILPSKEELKNEIAEIEKRLKEIENEKEHLLFRKDMLLKRIV